MRAARFGRGNGKHALMAFLRRAIDGYLDRRLAEAGAFALACDERWPHLRRHGGSPLAYAAVSDPAVLAFGDHRGFIAYGQKMGETFVLGDPVAAAEDVPSLIDDFIARMRRPVFVAVGDQTAALLAPRGYRVNLFGHDSVIDLPSHSFAGKDGKRIRYGTSWLKTNGMRVEERCVADFPAGELEAMSEDWRRSRVRTKREIGFLNRPLRIRPEADVRRFFALDGEDRPQGFISFDPVYRADRVIGYLASSKRRYALGSTYLDLAIMRHAIDAFKAEGREALWLGLSPLAPMGPSPYRDDPLLRRFFAFCFGSALVNRKLFNVQGIAEYKQRFRGRKVAAYVACPPGFNLVRMLALFRLIRLI